MRRRKESQAEATMRELRTQVRADRDAVPQDGEAAGVNRDCPICGSYGMRGDYCIPCATETGNLLPGEGAKFWRDRPQF